MFTKFASETQSVICTIPRSGTNLIEYFIRYLGLFLFSEEKTWGDEQYTFNSVAANNNTHRNLFPKVAHGYCPGYQNHINSPWSEKLSKIPESDSWFNAIKGYLDRHPGFDLANNQKCRVVFVYRNIYDFLLSLYDHLRNHKNYNLSEYNMENIAYTAIPQFIKSYVSFREMKALYPNNIIFLNYDSLVREREHSLRKICDFCDLHTISGNHEHFDRAFQRACRYTDKNEMKKLEQFMGKTLAGDQKFYSPNNSHIRSIDRKLQRNNITPDLLDKISGMLHEYNIYEFDVI
ncbi:MAG: sulfotransferase domain-containing protein [Limnospira sp. PMC 1234.20]|uniref:sulfotransferase domain-containing protein n=1 Tax=Limnospira sp. PMC 1234.20 TaxID=2981032 RepID=UPI0028E15ABF|nr:sulfotransferase domain-containing protein [Limnospira sp. PMC 1234.20]MDT9270897.1 sulfotransferase domain-containing protein [Limnospira sp. PMC 1234.20]